MISDLDLYRVGSADPIGLPPGSDRAGVVTGRAVGIDRAAGLVQVRYSDGEPVWVPAVPGLYVQDGRVRLLRSPLDGGRVSVCLGPIDRGPLIVGGTVVSVNAAAGTMVVTVDDEAVTLPFISGTYAAGNLVHVLRNADAFGTPAVVLGLAGNYGAGSGGGPSGGSGNEPTLVRQQRTILPTWSGSYRTSFSRWDSWNTDRYGGRSTLWQGNGYGSGPMKALAVYGPQIVNLRAVSIEDMQLVVWRADSSNTAARVPRFMCSPNGDPAPGGGPTGSGPEFGPAGLVPNQGTRAVVPASTYEAWRTGAYRGIATSGTDYMGVNGTPDRAPVRADGMALVVQFTIRK